MKFVTSPDVFFRFARELEAPHWRPYYVRWERVGRLRLDHRWQARCEVEINRGFHSMVRVWLPLASGRHQSPVGEPGLDALRADLERRGYERRQNLFLKRFRPTGARVAHAHCEIDACMWPELQPRNAREPSRGGIPGAMDYFLSAPAWVPSSCGWSRRVRLRNGVEVLFAILLMPREKGQSHHPEACVQLEPPKSVSRGRLRGLVELTEAAGYRGKVEVMRPKGMAPVLLGHFWRSRLGPAGAVGARTHLDALAQAMRERT